MLALADFLPQPVLPAYFFFCSFIFSCNCCDRVSPETETRPTQIKTNPAIHLLFPVHTLLWPSCFPFFLSLYWKRPP
jgi:hypothetical protein